MSRMKKLQQIIEEIESGFEQTIDGKNIMALLESEQFKDMEGNEIKHIKNHFEKVFKKNICEEYQWNKDEEFIKYYDLCNEEEKI